MVPPRRALALLADAAGRVALGIAIDEQHALVGEGERGGQIDRRGGLSDATLLVCDGDNLSHISIGLMTNNCNLR